MTLYVFIALMVLLWSGNYIVAKIALREVPHLLLMGVRFLMAGALILPVYFARPRIALTRRDMARLVMLGVFGVALNQVLFIVGISKTTVAHTGLLIALIPVLVLIIAGSLGMEKITATKVLGMGLAIAGVAILQSARGGNASVLGDAFVFLAAIVFAVFTVMGKKTLEKVDPITVNTFGYVGAALVLLPVTVWESRAMPITRFSPTVWLCLLYMAAFSSVFCYIIYYAAIRRMPASRVSALSYCQPVLASLMAVAWLGEQITVPLVAGGSVIAAGVILTERG